MKKGQLLINISGEYRCKNFQQNAAHWIQQHWKKGYHDDQVHCAHNTRVAQVHKLINVVLPYQSSEGWNPT